MRVQEVGSHQTRVPGHKISFSPLFVVGLTLTVVLDLDLNLIDMGSSQLEPFKSIAICKLMLMLDLCFDDSLVPLLEDKEGEIYDDLLNFETGCACVSDCFLVEEPVVSKIGDFVWS